MFRINTGNAIIRRLFIPMRNYWTRCSNASLVHRKNLIDTGFSFWYKGSGWGTTDRLHKKSMVGLIFTLHLVNFYDPCAGLAGIILILPAGIACPAPT